jgi:hypothetical protein
MDVPKRAGRLALDGSLILRHRQPIAGATPQGSMQRRNGNAGPNDAMRNSPTAPVEIHQTRVTART